MNAKERAEKILAHDDIDMFWDYDAVLEFCVAQITEAEREAYEKGKLWGKCEIQDARKEGFNTAKEKAAGIANRYYDQGWGKGSDIELIEKEIRAMDADK